MEIPGLGVVLGYAVGSFQILFIDWWKRIGAHRRQLRLLQAELRRLRTYESKFNWKDGLPPEGDAVPNPPRASELFVKTVGDIDWQLTDEFADDNSQQSFLHIVDGLTVLQRNVDELLKLADQARKASPPEKVDLRERSAAYAADYDSKLDDTLYLLDDALRDIGRRLSLTTFADQMGRAFDDLPAGINPPPLTRGDARVQAWRERQSRSAR